MIRITCTNCQKPLSLDETKLPMREVSFPCPVCKEKVLVDRRQFGTEEPAEADAAPHADADEDNVNAFGAKALIVGADDPSLRKAAKLIGLLPVFFADLARAREFFLQEFPQVVFVHPAQMTAPPLESMSAIFSLTPADRRRSFFVLVADSLRTLDGNAAFLYSVNVVVSKKDLPQFQQIHREAHAAHERLYTSINVVLRERQT